MKREVRKAVLNSIAITKTTLPHIIKRIRDVASEVRKQAFVILLQKIKINSLTIAQRTEIVKNGLNDR
jgi:condensin complex subunit 3